MTLCSWRTMKLNKLMWILNFVFLFLLVIPSIFSGWGDSDPSEIKDGVVPSDYKGKLPEGLTTFTVGGKQYSTSNVNRIVVTDGAITEFDGTLTKPADIGGSTVSGTLKYKNNEYTFTDGYVGDVRIVSANKVTISVDTISGIAGDKCSIDGNEFEKDSKFTYDKKNKVLKGELTKSTFTDTVPTITKVNPDVRFKGIIQFKLEDDDAFTIETEKPIKVVFDGEAPLGEEDYLVVNKESGVYKMNVRGESINIKNGGLEFKFKGRKTKVTNPSEKGDIPMELVNDLDPTKLYKVLQNGDYVGAVERAGVRDYKLIGMHSRKEKGMELYFAQLEVPEEDILELGLTADKIRDPKFQEEFADNIRNIRLVTEKTFGLNPTENMREVYTVTGDKKVKSQFELAGLYEGLDTESLKEVQRYILARNENEAENIKNNLPQKAFEKLNPTLLKEMRDYYSFLKTPVKKGGNTIIELKDGRGRIITYPDPKTAEAGPSLNFESDLGRKILSTFIVKERSRIQGQPEALLSKIS